MVKKRKRSGSGCSGVRMARELRDGALAFLPAPLRPRRPADPPVVGVDLVDDDHGGLRVFPEDVHEHLRHAADHLGLLLRRGPLPRDLDIYVRHPALPSCPNVITVSVGPMSGGVSPLGARGSRGASYSLRPLAPGGPHGSVGAAATPDSSPGRGEGGSLPDPT